MKIDIVGGPADGHKTHRPKASTVIVPVDIPGAPGIGQFKYTLRRCRDSNGALVEALAPAGQEIDKRYLAQHNLRN